jgi:ethanolamine utilization protein EutA
MNQDNSEVIKSVGIDIGTTTTQLVISRLTVKNVAPGTLVPRMQITDKVVDYKSDIYFTPIKDHSIVDSDKIESLIRLEFEKAGVKPEDIDTGAVIITGETAKKENAKKISLQIAGLAGDFVVATAGGKLESIIAGKGSGAADYSKKNFCTVANIDIGGGTSNVGVFKNGKAIDSCCINVGGRLLQVDSNSGMITYISNPMKEILDDCDIKINANEKVYLKILEKICMRMAEVVYELTCEKDMSKLSKLLLMTEPLRHDYKIDSIMISGGVADYVYNDRIYNEVKDVVVHGDIGPMLGFMINKAFNSKGMSLIKPTETIRATVIGAGAQTMDVSGSTILVEDSILPLKNVPVALPFTEEVSIDEFQIALNIKRDINNFFEGDSLANIAFAFQGIQYFTFSDVQKIARGIIKGTEQLINLNMPIIIVIEQDAGKVLGQTIKFLNPNIKLICVDQIKVDEGDYIDIGKSIAGGTVVPVVIKTLVFETKQI